MIRISLLPPELKKQQFSQEMRGNYAKIGAGVLALFLIVFLALLLVTMSANRQAAELRDDRAEIEQEIGELREFEIMDNQIREMEQLAKEAVGEIPHWGFILSQVGQKIPSEVWLTDFNAAQSGEVREITLRGMSPSHRLVADWLDEMHTLENLENIRSQFSAETIMDGQVWYQFEIKAVAVPEEPGSPLDRGGV